MKEDSLHDREKRQIPIDKLILPSWGDLRSYRDDAFAARLLSDLAKEGLFALPIVRACSDKPDGFFEVLDGWSRIEQLRRLGRQVVGCIVVDVDDASAVVLSLKMNIIRKPHDAIGVGATFKLLHDSYKMKYADIAERFGYHRAWVYKLVKLLTLPKDVQRKVAVGDISIKDAIAMVGGHYSPDVLQPNGDNRACDFCHGDFPTHLLDRVLICYKCQHQLNILIDQREKAFKEDLKRRAKQAKEGQKTLIAE